jgi:predicted transposase YbfD/YdcC
VSKEAQPIASQFERLTIKKSIARSHAMHAQTACSMRKLLAARKTNDELRIADAF